MQTAVIVILGAIVLTPAVTLGIMYWQYRSWPPALWKRRVNRRAESLRHQREQLKHASQLEDKVGRLFDEYFRRHLQAVPLEILDEYPGIGPATVARLRDAGYRRLAEISKLNFEAIPGIGPTRATALRDAVRTLIKQARSRFEAGACPEAQEYRRRVDAVRTTEKEKEESRERELAAVAVALNETEELQELARDITFWTYLFHRDEPGISDNVMDQPLPTVVVPPPQTVIPIARVAPVPPPVTIAAPSAAAKSFSPPVPPLPPATTILRVPAPPVNSSPPTTTPHPGLSKMRAFARFAFMVAKSDGRVAQSERKVIRSFLAAKFGHDDVLARHLDPILEQVEVDIPSESEALAGLQPIATEAERRELYLFAEQIADAAGERKPREREALERIALAFGIAATQPRPVPDQPTASAHRGVAVQTDLVPDPRALLEIPSRAELTPELIRRRFALLTDRIDPAKARELGPEFARMAEDKVARLRAAAEKLIAPFNEPLEKPSVPSRPTDLRHNPDLDDVFGG